MLDNYDIILASQSPRRQELLKGLDINFRTLVINNIDESYPHHLTAEEIPMHIAENKATAYQSIIKENTLIITADTIVWLDGKVYGKPQNHEDAINMISALSGKTHQVITGVCIKTANTQTTFTTTTDVTFANIPIDEIRYYVETYHPLDKAGAYGIQEWIGYIGVEHIHGSYFNVMGLPVQRLHQELKKIEQGCFE